MSINTLITDRVTSITRIVKKVERIQQCSFVRRRSISAERDSYIEGKIIFSDSKLLSINIMFNRIYSVLLRRPGAAEFTRFVLRLRFESEITVAMDQMITIPPFAQLKII